MRNAPGSKRIGKKFLDQWVALDGNNLVAHGTNARGVYNEARAQGVALALTPKYDFDLKSMNSPESMTTNRVAAAILTPEIRKPIRRIKR